MMMCRMMVLRRKATVIIIIVVFGFILMTDKFEGYLAVKVVVRKMGITLPVFTCLCTSFSRKLCLGGFLRAYACFLDKPLNPGLSFGFIIVPNYHQVPFYNQKIVEFPE